jgi:hypothetical protein
MPISFPTPSGGTGGGSIDLSNLPIYASAADAYAALGPDKPYRMAEDNAHGIASPDSASLFITVTPNP